MKFLSFLNLVAMQLATVTKQCPSAEAAIDTAQAQILAAVFELPNYDKLAFVQPNQDGIVEAMLYGGKCTQL